MASLEDLARKTFTDPPLSPAEERVVRALPVGTEADCSDLGGGNEPEKADGTPRAPDEKWPDTRNVRADLIRWLCVDRKARVQVDPKGIWIMGARITSTLDLSYTDILFPIFLLSCRFEEPLDLKWAKIPLLSLDGSRTRSIAADGLKLEGTLFLRGGFHAEGEVRLLGATVGGNLDAQSGTFRNLNRRALTADGIKVRGSVFLNKRFVAEGEVRLLGGTIGSDLDVSGGTFINPDPETYALAAQRCRIGGNLYLKNGFTAVGGVSLLGAEVEGQFEVIDAWLDATDLKSIDVTGSFIWRDIHKDLHAKFPEKEWKPSLDLIAAKVRSLSDQATSWPEKGRLRLDGFVYDRIAAGLADIKVPIDATARLKWLRSQPDELGFRPQPYQQLIAVLRQMGHEHQVAEVAIAKQKDLYDYGDLTWRGKFRSWFLYLVVGYGYRAWLAFIWLFLLIVMGSCVFSSAHYANVLVPSDKDAYAEYEKSKMEKLQPYYPDFHAPFYSLDVVLPFDLGQKSSWRLIERWPGDHAYWIYESYSLIQLFAGWVLLLVAAAVPAGFIKKD